MKINLVMIVRDEARSLDKCLRAAAPLADQIIVADTGSADATPHVARSYGAKVYDFPWKNDFSEARNFALAQSDGDWNLVLDADEQVQSGDRACLETAIRRRAGTWLGVLTRLDLFEDKEGRQTAYSLLPRLLPAGVRYTGQVHEQPDTALPCFPIPLQVSHDGYLRQGKGERNLALLRQAAADHPEDGYYQFQMALTLRNLGQLQESLKYFSAFYQQTDRTASFWAQGMTLYLYTLGDMGQLLFLEKGLHILSAAELFLKDRTDFCFACGIFYMKLVLADTARYIQYFPKIEESWLRCLALGEQKIDGGVQGTGSFKAAYNLGLLYEMGGNREKAFRFYSMAAEAGYEPGRKRLALVSRF